MNRIKLLIIDDSILFREVISRYFNNDDSFQIVGKAADSYSVRDLLSKHEPDVLIFDTETSKMDGVSFLKRQLSVRFFPTVVVSPSDKQRKDYIAAGAVEFIIKPEGQSSKNTESFVTELKAAIRNAAKKAASSADQKIDLAKTKSFSLNFDDKAKQPSNDSINQQKKHSKIRKTDAIIALGASTGGTEALIKVVKEFPEDTPPVLIVQHMPAGFTKMYAERLNRLCKMEVKEASDGDRLRRGLIILGAGEYHLRLQKDNKGFFVSSKPGERVSGHCPSVDVLFNSVAETAGPIAIGAIFTGMGRDGADGLLKMRKAGAFTIGQDKKTCVVYGMPMEAYNIGAVEVQAPLEEIAKIILDDLI